MASSWGDAWGQAWGDAWGVLLRAFGGGADDRRRKKLFSAGRRQRLLRIAALLVGFSRLRIVDRRALPLRLSGGGAGALRCDAVVARPGRALVAAGVEVSAAGRLANIARARPVSDDEALWLAAALAADSINMESGPSNRPCEFIG